MSSFQWKGEGMEQVWNFPILPHLVLVMHTHAEQALRPVIVPAGVTRCTPLFRAFILSSGEFATPSLSQVSSAPSLPLITSEPKGLLTNCTPSPPLLQPLPFPPSVQSTTIAGAWSSAQWGLPSNEPFINMTVCM